MPIFPLLLAAALPLATSAQPAAPAQSVDRAAATTVRYDRAHAEQMAARVWPADADKLHEQFQAAMREGKLSDAARAAAQLCTRTGEACLAAERLAGNVRTADVILTHAAAHTM